MAIVSDLLQLCRLCLVKDEVNVPIFEGESDDQQISLKISSCLPVTLSQDDRLPQKICSECCRKLDTLYEFRNSSVNAEKQLVTWLEELENQSKKTSEKMSIATESLSEKTIVKEEIDEVDENGALSNEAEDYILQQQVAYDKTDLLNDAADETGEPQPKRAKRAAALKALIHTQESEEDEEDIDEPEPITKAEEESEPSETDINESVDDTFAGGPSTSADDQPGPSGVGKSTEGPNHEEDFVPKRRSARLKTLNLISDKATIVPKRTCTTKPARKSISNFHYNNTENNEEDKGSKRHKNGRPFIEWKCKKCEERFETRRDMLNHKQIHKTPNEFKHKDDPETHTYKLDETLELYICNTCSAEFQDEEEVRKHIESHVTRYDCEVCNETFTKAYHYAIHRQKHSEDGNFMCPICSTTTPRRTVLLTHINTIHLRRFLYECETCGKGFNDAVLVKEHNNEHLGIKPFICVVCEKSFTYSRYLLIHQTRYHTVRIEGIIQRNQCSICLRIFAKLSTLENHIATRHRSSSFPLEKKHLCDICGQGFARNCKLKIHYRTHTGYKPYACSYCEKKFIKKEYLVMHERVHNGEKPYSCEYCGKCFNQTAPLRIHVRVHTGERPYICQLCEGGFISRSALNFHLKNYCLKQEEEN